MAKDYINFKLVEELSEKDNTELSNQVIKLSEETGELSQAFLKYNNAPNVSASAVGTKDGMLEECCDVINTAMAIINALDATDKEANAMFEKKLAKWESKL